MRIRPLFFALTLSSTVASARSPSDAFEELALPLTSLHRDPMVPVDSVRFHALAEHLCVKFMEDPSDQWSYKDHINLLRCTTTIVFESRPEERSARDPYQRFDSVIDANNYIRWIADPYPRWTPNRGIGLYFPDVDIELNGTPPLRGRFNVH